MWQLWEEEGAGGGKVVIKVIGQVRIGISS